MQEPNSPSRISNNPNIWVKCLTSDTNSEVVSHQVELSDSNEQFNSIFGQGCLKLLQDKIIFSQEDKIIAFINFCEELNYSTLYSENVSFLKFTKYGKETFVSIEKKSLDLVDQQLRKILFKEDFILNYETLNFIGNGSFSQVTLAKNKREGMKYAVKAVQKSRITSSAQNKKELMNEINLLRKINHDKILKAHEFYSTENAFKMVLEYYSGGTLEQKLEQSQGFTLFQNIVHRDLKPDNVLFCDLDSFDIVVSDVGLAQDINEEFIFTKCGTPGYVAPEILNSTTGKGYGVISDMFSCGVLFYRLAVGKPIFSGKSHVEVLEENKKCKIDLSCQEFKLLPVQIQKIIDKMLQVKPENRISAQESLNTLFYKLNPTQSDYFCKNLVQQQKGVLSTLKKLNSIPYIQRKFMKIDDIKIDVQFSPNQFNLIQRLLKRNIMAQNDQNKNTTQAKHNQRFSIQYHQQISPCNSPKLSVTPFLGSSDSLQKNQIGTKEKNELKKSNYKKQASHDSCSDTSKFTSHPFVPITNDIKKKETMRKSINLTTQGSNIQMKKSVSPKKGNKPSITNKHEILQQIEELQKSKYLDNNPK